MWPSGNGTVADGMQGTSLFTDPNETHSTNHRQIGTIVNSLTTVFGTTAGTGLFAGYAVGQLPLPIQSGTLGTLITKGTINTSVIGTSQFTGGTVGTTNLIGGTLAGQIQNNGTVANGVYGTAQIIGGSATGITVDATSVLLPLKSAFWAIPGTAGQTFGTNAVTQVHYGSKNYDLLGEFGTAANNFIAQNAGLYSFSAFVDVSNLSTNPDVQIRLNGTAQQGNSAFIGNTGGFVFWQGSVSAGGTVDVAFYNLDTTHIGTMQVNVAGTAGFYGHRIF